MSRTQVTDALITAAQGGDGDAMWAILCAYEPDMRAAVRAEAPKANEDEAEDLLQEARAILIQHLKAFDSTVSAASLSTYSYRAIRHGVAIAWTSMLSTLTVEPHAMLTVKRALWQTDGDVEGAWMIVGSDSDARRRMSWETFQSVVEALGSAVSLEAPAGDDDGVTVAETIPDPDSDFTDPTARRELCAFLLREIPQRQAFTLRAFYGISMTRQDDHSVAADMDLKPHAVRLLRSRGLDSCRAVAARHDIAA
ncbi:RNA polymerase sigma factor [Streptomyces zaomyceticus]|uniref:RNA polymerase sigma factor n=1 Tax=Streptomyces zaomyceticus TaxID=68286 RepID=UPI003426A119